MRLFRRRRRALVCRQAVQLMFDYVDGQLQGGDRARLEAHLVDCPHCSEYLAQLKVTLETLGKVEPEALEPAALDEMVEVYRRWRTG